MYAQYAHASGEAIRRHETASGSCSTFSVMVSRPGCIANFVTAPSRYSSIWPGFAVQRCAAENRTDCSAATAATTSAMRGEYRSTTPASARISPYHSAAITALVSPHCVVIAGTVCKSASRTRSGLDRFRGAQTSRKSATASPPIAACAARNSAISVACICTGHAPGLRRLNQLTCHRGGRRGALLRSNFLNLTLRQTEATLHNSGALQRLIRRHGLNRPVRRGLRRDITRRSPVNVRFPRDRKSTRLNSSHVAISYAVL